MIKPEIAGIAPFFIVKNVPSSLEFYRDRLGFDIAFQGPEPNDIFFGIVQRGAAAIMLKAVGVDPLPNYTRDIGLGAARWDAYVQVPDPNALAAEFSSRNVEFSQPLMTTTMACADSLCRTPMATFCFSAGLAHKNAHCARSGTEGAAICFPPTETREPYARRSAPVDPRCAPWNLRLRRCRRRLPD